MFSFPRKQPPPSTDALDAGRSSSLNMLKPTTKQPSPTARKPASGNNDKKTRKFSIPLHGAFHRSASLNGTMDAQAGKADPAIEQEEEDAHEDGLRQPTTTLRSVRSLYIDPHPPARVMVRDFSLHPIKPSPLPHEDCTSLREQFLKIKERFSGGSTSNGSKSSSSATVSSAKAASSAISNADSRQKPPDCTDDQTPTTAATPPPNSDHSSTTASANDATTSESLIPPTIEASMEAEDKSMASYRPGPSDEHYKMLRALDDLNAEVKSLVAAESGDGLWPQPNGHTLLERWFLEDNYLKGSMTCWTIEKGAELVQRIASVVAKSSPTLRMNPDISLQWIGRQLWGVTVQLPLTLSGELKPEHIAVGRLIDEAIIEEWKKQQAGASRSNRPSVRTIDETSAADNTILCINNQFPTLVSPPIRDDTSPDAQDLDLDRTANEDAEMADNALETSGIEFSSLNSPQRPGEGGAAQVMDGLEPQPRSRLYEVQEDNDGELHDDDISSKSVTLHEDEDRILHGVAVQAAPAFAAWTKLSFSSISTTPLNPDGGATLEEDSFQRFAPDKTGWLKKKTGLNAWQARYFELKGNRLYYFASETDGVPRGVIILDHAHVLRGTGEHAMTFTITMSNAQHALQIIKFTGRASYHTHTRKHCIMRVVDESEEAVSSWVTALNRASFYCNLICAPTTAAHSTSFASPGKRRQQHHVQKMPFYRLRSASSSNSSAEENDTCFPTAGATIPLPLDGPLHHHPHLHHYGSVKYLQETDPLLWEIHPHDQVAIRKKASIARTKSDYLHILSKYNGAFRQIFLPRPRPISIEQTLRDILPELFLINNILYGGGDGNNGLENIFEVLDSYVKRFATAHEERVRAVSTLLQACARTISGGDSYFVVHSLLGNPSMIIRPAEARGHPIEIEVSSTNPCQFCITVFSAFSFHHIEDVEKYGDDCYKNEPASSPSNGGTDGTAGGTTTTSIASTPEPLLRVQTYHIQEFDFASGKSSRWLRIRADGMKEDDAHAHHRYHGWMKGGREASESGYGALLDALSQ